MKPVPRAGYVASLEAQARQAFATHAGLPFAAACRVVPGQLGEAAGLLGAAAFVLVPDRYGWDPDPAPGH